MIEEKGLEKKNIWNGTILMLWTHFSVVDQLRSLPVVINSISNDPLDDELGEEEISYSPDLLNDDAPSTSDTPSAYVGFGKLQLLQLQLASKVCNAYVRIFILTAIRIQPLLYIAD